MIFVVPQTQEQKRKMYKKIKKDRLIEMLINANEELQRRKPVYPKIELFTMKCVDDVFMWN